MSTAKDMIEKTEKAKKFLYRYNMEIVDSNRRYQRYTIPTMSISAYDKFKDEYLHNPIHYETEILYTIQIPESRLESLVDFHDRVEESMKYTGSMDVFNDYIRRDKEEQAFREKHPAVQKAYEQYRMLYKLAKSGEY